MTIDQLLAGAREASRSLALTDDKRVSDTLMRVADALQRRCDEILDANASDLAAMDSGDPRYDRLALTPERVAAMAADMRAVAALPSPVGVVLEERRRPNGMTIRKVSVPFGVIGVIYEARPNVTSDVFALTFRAGSACVLKGGHEAAASNAAIVSVIASELDAAGIDPAVITLLDNDRDTTAVMLGAVGGIDLIIPRGSRRLIDFVRQNARVPVIETGAGVCHTYIHDGADVATARDIVFNAKTRRVSVCNALDCLVVDRSRLAALPAICHHLAEKDVEIHADPEAYAALEGAYPLLTEAADDDYGREWLDYKLTIKTVGGIDEAIDFVRRHSSGHSECIITESPEATRRFQSEIDAACVYANVSTAFTDGAQFGMGAEIGISTQKLHARGPMALREITTYKYLVNGSGQTRP